MPGYSGPLPMGDGVRVEPAAGARVAGTPLSPLPEPGPMALGDCNGDGRLDLIVAPGSVTALIQGADGKFTASPLSLKDDSGGQSRSLEGVGRVALSDLDGDGVLDLVVTAGNSPNFQVSVVPGHGDCTFGPVRTVTDPVNGFAVDIQIADVDFDGLADISVAYSLNLDAPVAVFRALGDGSYSRLSLSVTPAPLTDENRALELMGFVAFSSWFDDVDRDGAQDMFMLLDHRRGWFSFGAGDDAISFVKAPVLADPVAHASAMAVAPLDMDRDGKMDYFISGGEHSSAMMWNRGPRDFIDIAAPLNMGPGHLIQEWGSYAFDADLDGWLDVMLIRKFDPTPEPPTVHGLYMNRHDGSFVDVGATAFDTQVPAVELACGDLASDGHVVCFARDPSPITRMEVNVAPRGGWVGLRLQGTVSAPHGDGARVSLDGAARPLVMVTGGQSPTHNTHDRGLLVPVGAATSASLTIEWPSGIIQAVPNLKTGTYTRVIEPRVLTLSARTAPADAKTTIDVFVDPAPVAAMAVSIEGDASISWLAPAARGDDGRWKRTLRAPATPGSARITITLDGKVLKIRPRVTFN